MTNDKSHLAAIISAWDAWCAALSDDAGRFDEDIAHGRLCSAIESARPQEGTDEQGVPWCRLCPDGTCRGTEKLAGCDIRAAVHARKIDAAEIVPRDEVQWFARYMEIKLRENDHKEHWTHSALWCLLNRLFEECEELRLSIESPNPSSDDAIREAADVANFAMMIADCARKAVPR